MIILSILWCSTSTYFGKWIESNLDNSNHANSSNILFFKLLLDCMVFKWEPCICGYLLKGVIASIFKILKGRPHWLQSNLRKTRDNMFLLFFPHLGIEHRNLSVLSHHTSLMNDENIYYTMTSLTERRISTYSDQIRVKNQIACF